MHPTFLLRDLAFHLRLALAMVGVLALGMGQAQECDITISGSVIDDHDKTPLSLAEIHVLGTGRGAISDMDGRYSLGGLCPGSYVIRVTHLGCDPVERRVTLNSDQVLDFRLEHHHEELREFEVVREKPDENVGQARSVVDREALERNAGRSFAEALDDEPGVMILRSGPTIAKPVIHGHSGNRVLILQQGMRQEDQQWGTDHAPNLDPFSGDGITVVKGAASVQYGSDAIGGVIINEPARTPRQPGLGGEVRALGMLNGRGGGGGGELYGGSTKVRGLGWRIQGSGRRLGDQRSPGYMLSNTGLREAAGSASVGLNRHWGGVSVNYSLFGREMGIMRTAHAGNLTDLANAIDRREPWYIAPFGYTIDAPRQEALHHLFQTEFRYHVRDRNMLVIAYGYQADERREFDIRRAGRSAQPTLDLFLTTHMGSAVYKHWIGPKLHGKAGIDGAYQANYNIPGTGVRPLIPNYAKETFGGFILEHYPVTDALELEAGLRLESTYLLVGRFTNVGEYVTPEHRFFNHAFSVGGNWQVNEQLRLRSNISSAFRPPHVSELYSEGLHHGSAAIEVGDATLEGERSLKMVVDAEGTWNNDRFRAWLTLYHDRVDGYIYLRPTGYQLTIRGAFPAFEYTSTTATLTGIDAMTDLHLRHGLHWRVRASMLRARDEEADDWLFLMPTDRLTNELVFTMPKLKGMRQLRFSVMSTLVARQVRYPAEVDFTDPPAGYHLMGAGLSASWPMGRNSLRFGIEAFNLLNTSYRDYLDRFRYFADAPGMDLVVNLRYTFGAERQ